MATCGLATPDPLWPQRFGGRPHQHRSTQIREKPLLCASQTPGKTFSSPPAHADVSTRMRRFPLLAALVIPCRHLDDVTHRHAATIQPSLLQTNAQTGVLQIQT